jgi:PAS domain S-box-containing protein
MRYSTIDSAGLIQSFNPRAEAMSGYPAAEVLGHALTTLMPPSYREAHEQGLRNNLATGVCKMMGGRVKSRGSGKMV